MTNSIITNNSTNQVMKVYSARAYTVKNPRKTKYVQVNIQEYVPTIPQDNQTESIGLASGFFANQNYPVNTGTLTVYHYLEIPLLSGSSCPTIFSKGTPFLLFTPTSKMEEGYLMYI